MNNKKINLTLRFLTLPMCGGFGLAIGFMIISLIIVGDFYKYLGATFIGLLFVGGLLSMMLGWPLLIVLERWFQKYRLRYVVGGWSCALLAWLFIEGAFFPGAWSVIWNRQSFWVEFAPRRIFIFSVVGLLCGAIYTGAVCLINKKFPYSD